jgi:transposase
MYLQFDHWVPAMCGSLVAARLRQDSFSGSVFVFRSKCADRIKLLTWDETGMVLVHKRLEGATFVWPQVRDGVMRMSPAQLAALFEGLAAGDRRGARKAPVLAGTGETFMIHFMA